MSECSVQILKNTPEDGMATVKIAGSTTITNVSMLLMELLAAFQQADSITIDLSGVTEIDAAGLQLFCSSHRSSIFSNKQFSIVGQDQPIIWDAATASGQLRTFGCALDTQHTCIWTGGTR